jgi:THO complex subunit 5
LARLEWELTQRKQLALLCDNLSENKKSVATSIESKQSRLDNLAPQLRSILEVMSIINECSFNIEHFKNLFIIF